METLELPVQRALGLVMLKPHHVRRDVRRNGKTSEAAVRLARYKVNRMLKTEGWMPVSDVELRVGYWGDDFMRDQRTIIVDVRCVDRLECESRGIQPFTVPPNTYPTVIRIPLYRSHSETRAAARTTTTPRPQSNGA